MALDAMIESVREDMRENDPGNHATIGALDGELKGLMAARTYVELDSVRSHVARHPEGNTVCQECGGRLSACNVLGHRPESDRHIQWQTTPSAIACNGETPRTDALMDTTSPVGFKGQAMVDLARELERGTFTRTEAANMVRDFFNEWRGSGHKDLRSARDELAARLLGTTDGGKQTT